ncbi:MAG TPA: PAS domain-containing protein, partial [Gammaproteobacteria bacterium]|nr:PAS domain-containing protein [Gammaproteobacteria bacterium]
VSPQGNIIWANRKELELMGYSKEEYIGHHISEFYADRFVINDILCRLIYDNEVVNYPAEVVRKDGSRVQVLLNSNVYKQNGSFVHARSSMRDVSELKIFQTRLENSNARVLNQLLTTNTLLNMVSNASWQTDYQGYITAPQIRWTSYTGQDESEQLKYGWLKALHPDDRLAMKANLIAAIRENHDFKQLCRVYSKVHKDYMYCGIYGTPISSLRDHTFEWQFILIDESKTIAPDTY